MIKVLIPAILFILWGFIFGFVIGYGVGRSNHIQTTAPTKTVKDQRQNNE